MCDLHSSLVIFLLSLGGVPSQTWVGSHLALILGVGEEGVAGVNALVVAQTWSLEATS